MFKPLSIALSLACISGVAKAHEFWIDPADFTVAPGGIVTGELRVGEKYEGVSTPFLPPRFERFDFAINDRSGDVPGRVGDRPALRMSVPEAGLLIVTHETKDQRIVWNEWEKFVSFVEHKDAAWALERHAARGLDQVDATEAYSRYAKSLIAIGMPVGEDRVVGLETEIVALENPYIGETDDGVDVQVLYQGQPRVNEQIEIFEKSPAGAVTISTLRTDGQGKATIPVKRGHRYMLDSVVVREPSAELAAEMDVEWETLWANLTFAVPTR
ncbi:MAG: DUF4198 domain-containing protein [Pseudomonadota bacterium]